MNHKKRILIISFFSSDKRAYASVRINGFAKYLPQFGWEPVILTARSPFPPDSRFNVVESDYEDIFKKWRLRFGLQSNENIKTIFTNENTNIFKNTAINHLIQIGQEIIAYPDAYIGWKKFAVDCGSKLLEQNKFDAILSSSGPETCHLIANELKKKFEIPWIADFRDLWTESHFYRYSSIRRAVEKRLEIQTISYANALTTVSAPLLKKMEKIHKNKAVYIVPNGFDPDEVNPGSNLKEKLIISYTGYIYQSRQDPEPLFIALKELDHQRRINLSDFRVDFYGYSEEWLKRLVNNYGLNGIVSIHERISRDEAIRKQWESQILLLLSWRDPRERGVYTGKIFDYLAAQRPILSIGSSGGVVEELLRETNAGVHKSDIAGIENELERAYLEFMKKGSINYEGNIDKIYKYSHKEMTKKLVLVLNNITN